jgi:hypothetical protein
MRWNQVATENNVNIMGQAKQRGTYEQRKQSAVARKQALIDTQMSGYVRARPRSSPRRSLIGAMAALSLAGWPGRR